MKYFNDMQSHNTGKMFMDEPIFRSRRVEQLRNRLIEETPMISSERAVILTEAYKEFNNEPITLKRAKSFAKILDNMTILIAEGEIIVGNLGDKLRCAPIYPEFGIDWIIEELNGKPMRPEDRPGDRYEITKEDEAKIRGMYPFWHNNTHEDRCKAILPKESILISEMGICNSNWLMIGGEGHLTVDLRRVIREGMSAIIQQAKDRKVQLDLSVPEQMQQKSFLESVVVSLEAVIRFAKRFSDLAREKAQDEMDTQRKMELEKIAEVCARVPGQPARDFHEALQAMWFTNLCIQIETNGHSISLGRFDVTLIDYYQKDIDDRTLEYSDSMELVECFFLKMYQLMKITTWGNTKSFSGYQLFQNITIGGQDKNGKDSTNALSYLVLAAQASICLTMPSISLRYHDRINEKIMYAALDVIRLGGGQPAIYSDEVYIPALVNRGIAWEDAVNYSIVGCVEAIVEGKQTNRPNGAGFVNLGKILELALYNGEDPNTGICLCPGTGDLTTFKSYEEVYMAFKRQIEYYFRYQIITDNILDKVAEEDIADPYVSCLVSDCVARGKTMKQGGAIYDFCGPLYVGIANVGNALAAIRKLIFDDQVITGQQMMHALKTNYEDTAVNPTGTEIKKMMLDAPKYGNDDDFVDSIMVDYFRFICEETAKYKTTRFGRGPIGGTWQPSTSSVSANIPFGEVVGATPDGRSAGEALADTASPTHGTDTKGLTLSLKSVGKLPTVLVSGGQLLNIKVSPASLERNGAKRLLQLLRTYLGNYKGMHVQINVISAGVLRKAQEHPELYKDLMVRVAGYSALFTPLDKALQEDIIARTEHII